MGKARGVIAAGVERPFSVSGNYLFVVASTEILEIELVRKSQTVETHFVKQGGGLYDKDFDSIVVKNEGASSSFVHIVTGQGKYSPSQSDSRVTVDTSAGSVPVTLDETQLNLQVNQQTTGATNNGLPKVTLLTGETKKLCNVNATRKYVKYNILSSSDCEYVTVGGSLVDAASGYALERGMVGADETTGELWVHNPQTETAVVWAMEVSD